MNFKQLSDDQKKKFIQCLNRINDNVTAKICRDNTTPESIQIFINILKSNFETIAKIENTNENKKKEM